MNVPRRALVFVSILGSTIVSWSAGCGGGGSNSLFGNGAGNTGGTGGGSQSSSSGITFTTGTGTSSGTASGGPCTGIQCNIHSCSGGGSTTISGTILDPAGKNPLYGVVAYIPNSKPAALLSGTSCQACDSLYTGDPIAAAVSGVDGKFTIPNVPDGQNIPLVIQIGKWRRQFTLPSVTACMDNPVTQTLTLPKNGTEGDLPNIAISTGGADTLECLLTRVGVDEAEYVPGISGSGHIHIFQGGGGGFNGGAPNTNPGAPGSSQALWDVDKDIMRYDIVMLSCEGSETANMNQQVLMDYANQCGRVFASHFHYAWFNTGPFAAFNLATWTPGSNQIGNSLTADVITTFQMGQNFHDWLQGVGALTNNLLTIYQPRHNADLSAANTNSQLWLEDSTTKGLAQDFTFDTPLGQPADAGTGNGRVVFSDMHVGATGQGVTADYSGGSQTVPSGCAVRDLSAQEKALEFILFNLSSCVTPGGGGTQPPPTNPQTM
jgi:hypothetical protein